MKRHPTSRLFAWVLAALPLILLSLAASDARPPVDDSPDAAALLQDTTCGDASEDAAAKDKLAIPSNYPRICRRYAQILSSRHFLQKPLDETVSAQAWTNFIMCLDYDRSYFLAEDIASFDKWRTKLSSCLSAGDFAFPLAAFKLYRRRVAERADYAEKLIDGGFDFSKKECYVWKRKDAPWPENRGEQDELWRKRVKNDVLARMVAMDYQKSNEVAKAAAKAADKAADEATDDAATADDAADNAADNATDAADNAADAASSSPTNAAACVDMSPGAVVRKLYRQRQIFISDLDSEWVLERYLSAFAAAYDPHTAYMAPPSVEDFNTSMTLTLCGIGATLTTEDGAAKIVEIIPGSPVGRDTRDIRLREGDKIVGVGQGDGPIEDVVHRPLSKIVKRIRGKKGTKVVLQVVSGSDASGASSRLVDLIRDDIKLEEQAATGTVVRVASPLEKAGAGPGAPSPRPRSFGVVRLPTFYGSATSDPGAPGFRSCAFDVMKIVSRMNHEIEGLVLDLRGNGGGSLREAVSLAGSFIRTGPVVIVQEIGLASALPDRDPAVGFRKPMVVLVDRASASASEIVAAALQDYGRAVIVGDHKTHGKGSVQTIMPLMASDPSYGSIRLTCAKFFRIDGGSTQLRGVEPDIVLPSMLEYLDVGEDKLPNAMPWTSIRPAGYTPAYDLGPIVPGLASNAFARLADDKEYREHLEKVGRMKELSERTSQPLDYATRYRLFEEDKDAGGDDDDDDGDGAGGGDGPPPDGDWTRGDVVLRAALDILADLVDAQGDSGIADDGEPVPPDWLLRLFK